MKIRLTCFYFILAITFSLTFTSCSSSANLVVSNGVELSNYKYVCFGNEHTGDRELDDLMMMVQNEISNTRLQTISLSYAPSDYLYLRIFT